MEIFGRFCGLTSGALLVVVRKKRSLETSCWVKERELLTRLVTALFVGPKKNSSTD